MGIWLGPRGKPASKLPPLFTSTGTMGADYLYAEEEAEDGTIHWEIAVLSPCAFNFSRVGKVDMTLIGAGEQGGGGNVDSPQGISIGYGGKGGDGGKILRLTEQTLALGTSYLVNPGVSNGAATTFSGGELSYSSADGASEANGGVGAVATGNGQGLMRDGGDGDPGVSPFAQYASLTSPNYKFGAGGGGGGCTNANQVYKSAGSGGVTGGGAGGTRSSPVGGWASGRGAGGGGGFGQGSGVPGGTGGSGIALIRGAR